MRFFSDGHAQFIEQLVKAEVRRGIAVTVVAPRNIRRESRKTKDGALVHRFPYFFSGSLERLNHEGGISESLKYCKWAFVQLPFFYFMFLLTAFRESKRANIVHAHQIPTGAVAYIVSMLRKIPYVVTIMDSDKDLMRMRSTRPFTKFILKKAAHVTTVNNSLKESVERLGIQHRHVTTIYSGLEMERFRPGNRLEARSRLGFSSTSKILLYVGTLIKQKGLADLVNAVKRLTPKHSELKVLIVGKGAARAELEHIIWRLGITHLFHFTGPIAHGKMHGIYQASDIFVLPSHSEERPNVVLEAMSAGLCTVATDVGGIPEIIKDGQNGILVPARNPGRLAAALDLLLEDSTIARRLGEEARKWSQHGNISWDQSAELFEELFRRINDAKG